MSHVPSRVATIIIAVALCAALFFVKWNTIHDPYLWDDLGAIIAPALDMYDHDYRLIHPRYNFGHPPVQQLFLALTWNIFGYSIAISHLAMLVVGAVGLVTTYLLGKKLFDERVGISAAILLLFHHVFFSQTGLVNDSIFLLTLGVLTVYAHVLEKKWVSVLFASLLVLTKETALVVIIAIVCHELLRNAAVTGLWGLVWKNTKEAFYKLPKTLANTWDDTRHYLIPIVLLFGWLVYNRYHLGWAVRTDLIKNAGEFFTIMLREVVQYFVYFDGVQTSIYMGFLSLMIIVYLTKQREWHAHAIPLLLLLVAGHVMLFALTDSYPRYYPPALPFYFILASAAVFHLSSKKKPLFPYLLILVFGIMATHSYFDDKDSPPYLSEGTMDHRSFVHTHVDSINFIEKHYSDRTIIAEWPMTDKLREPRFGYVEHPHESILDATIYRRDMYAIETGSFNKDTLLQQTGAIVLVDATTNNPILAALALHKHTRPIIIFEDHRKMTGIFEIGRKEIE